MGRMASLCLDFSAGISILCVKSHSGIVWSDAAGAFCTWAMDEGDYDNVGWLLRDSTRESVKNQAQTLMKMREKKQTTNTN